MACLKALPGESLVSFKKNTPAWLWFAKLLLNKLKDFRNTVKQDQSGKGLVITHSARWKTNTAYQHKHIIPTVKHGGGEVMI